MRYSRLFTKCLLRKSRCSTEDQYPGNLPAAFTCRDCNQEFSEDGQYFYVFLILNCVLAGSTEPDDHDEEGVQRTLEQHSELRSQVRHWLSLYPALLEAPKSGLDLLYVPTRTISLLHQLFQAGRGWHGDHLSFFPDPFLSHRAEITVCGNGQGDSTSAEAIDQFLGKVGQLLVGCLKCFVRSLLPEK